MLTYIKERPQDNITTKETASAIAIMSNIVVNNAHLFTSMDTGRLWRSHRVQTDRQTDSQVYVYAACNGGV